ncbi:uncharacterized protein N7482_008873 [Penicillium canariense]|uniref:Flavin reductase like domain-containing protein n=1 Tax=Penicillium canariense TaxID=189055 RepID=A0A9W9HW22_9EURO|nr:uncharacterized protein N7482_008873 [Penicillium canariense]KAJ5157773.1 hypothetical protein N7482_008873 [Penicillium canariense]
MPPKRKASGETHPHKGKSQSSASQKPQGFKSYTLSHAYRLIEPGPVLLVSTGSLSQSTHNIMTIGFHMVMQHESPPLVGITLGPWDASFATLQKQRECVLAVPSVEIAEKVVDIGNTSAEDSEINKWDRFGLDALPATKVDAPLVGGPHVIANVECVVEDTAMVHKYNMWVLRPVQAWVSASEEEGGRMFHHRGQGIMVADGEVLDFSRRMVKWQEFVD